MQPSLRPVRLDDEAFLERVYASTRAEELAQVDWDDEQKQSFIRMQFTAQHRHYQEHFPQASFQIICDESEPIGRLYVDRRDDEIRIIDIALLPTYRGRGIGSALLKSLLAEAQDGGLPVRIHVERFNPALRLYERLGFSHLDDNGVYFLMEWVPRRPDRS